MEAEALAVSVDETDRLLRLAQDLTPLSPSRNRLNRTTQDWHSPETVCLNVA